MKRSPLMIFALLGLLAAPLAVPTTHAQGFFDEKPEGAAATSVAEEQKEAAKPSAEWTKQQLARAVVEATSPVFSMADVKTPTDLERVQETLKEAKEKRQKMMEETFTREELNALYEFYSSPVGGGIGAKLGMLTKPGILKQAR